MTPANAAKYAPGTPVRYAIRGNLYDSEGKYAGYGVVESGHGVVDRVHVEGPAPRKGSRAVAAVVVATEEGEGEVFLWTQSEIRIKTR